MYFIKVLAPMAGISDGEFCLKLIPYGFDMVTLGGYNADKPTISAGKQILARGRPEFDVAEEDLFLLIESQAQLIKENWNGLVSVNLRSLSPEPIIEISHIKEIDVIEINAHCRQKEITDIGCGQALLQDVDLLEGFTSEVVKKSSSAVSVKIRANVEDVDEVKISRVIEKAGADYFHVDAMKPGFNQADLDIIQKISSESNIFLIGNNSIKDIQSARRMFEAGANGISIARAAIKGDLPFKLSKI